MLNINTLPPPHKFYKNAANLLKMRILYVYLQRHSLLDFVQWTSQNSEERREMSRNRSPH